VTRAPGRPKAIRRFLGSLFVATAFGFLGYFVASNIGQLRAHDWQVRPALLAASLLLHVAGLFWGVAVWQMLLRRLGSPVGLIDLARIWFVSGLGRYIPGKVWHFVGAAHLGNAVGLSLVVTVTSLAVHTGVFAVAALLTAVYLLPSQTGQTVGFALEVSRWFAPAALLLVHPAAIRNAIALARRLSKREMGDWTGRWIDGIVLVGLASIAWLITGLAFYLFVESLTPIGLEAATALIAANSLAFVAGYLVFFVPAGLGAKEGALTALLTLYLPAPVAALLAIAARLWTIAAEVLPALALLRWGGSPAATSDPGTATRRNP